MTYKIAEITHEHICPSCGELLIVARDGVTIIHRAGSTCPLLPVVASAEGWAGIAAAILYDRQRCTSAYRVGLVEK